MVEHGVGSIYGRIEGDMYMFYLANFKNILEMFSNFSPCFQVNFFFHFEKSVMIEPKTKKSKGYWYLLFSTKFLLSALPALEDHSFIGKKNVYPHFFAPHYVGVGGGFVRLKTRSSFVTPRDNDSCKRI